MFFKTRHKKKKIVTINFIFYTNDNNELLYMNERKICNCKLSAKKISKYACFCKKRHVPCWIWATTVAEDCFLALSAWRRRHTTIPQHGANHFIASEKRISTTRVWKPFHNASFCARWSKCVPLNRWQRRACLNWQKMFPGPDSNGLLKSSQSSTDSHKRAIQSIYWSEENNAPDTINPTSMQHCWNTEVSHSLGELLVMRDIRMNPWSICLPICQWCW